jgi:hypothetical protein
MPYRSHHAFLLLATLGAAACTTLTAEQRIAACRATDWASYGRNDGVLGVATSGREEKFADCAALGYPADIAAYQAGRAEGLGSYCTVENGYEVGYAGRRYRKVCPPELEPGFLQGYQQGRKERPASYYPYYGFGFGYSRYSYFGYRFGYHGHRYHNRHRHHHWHRRHRRGSGR